VTQLRTVAAKLGHPLYWLGHLPRTKLELTETNDGRIYVRYLPLTASAGDPRAHLTVGTYPVPDALAAAQAVAQRPGAREVKLGGGALAVVDPAHRSSVYVGFPQSRYQVEVFDPNPARARRLATSRRLSNLG
jgi:hypothetical protein